MLAISEIRLYDILTHKFKLKEIDAKEIIAEIAISNEKSEKLLSEKIEDRFKNLKDIFLTKEDKVDIIKWVAIMIIGQTALLVTLIKMLA